MSLESFQRIGNYLLYQLQIHSFLIYQDTNEKMNVTKVYWLDLKFNEPKNKSVNVYKDQCKEYKQKNKVFCI